jgi:hypothetical protein
VAVGRTAIQLFVNWGDRIAERISENMQPLATLLGGRFDYLEAALRETARVSARKRIKDPYTYALRIAEGYVADGGPPDEPTAEGPEPEPPVKYLQASTEFKEAEAARMAQFDPQRNGDLDAMAAFFNEGRLP